MQQFSTKMLFDVHFYRDYYKDPPFASDVEAFRHWLSIGYRTGRVCNITAFFCRHDLNIDHIPRFFSDSSAVDKQLPAAVQRTRFDRVIHYMRALETGSRPVHVDGSSADFYESAGAHFTRRGNRMAAMACLRAVAVAEPERIRARADLATLQLSDGEVADAVSTIRDIISKREASAGDVIAWAGALERLCRFDTAIEIAAAGVTLYPGDVRLNQNYIRLLEEFVRNEWGVTQSWT